jgi:NitT/TauT family transport system substrate-binding protein
MKERKRMKKLAILATLLASALAATGASAQDKIRIGSAVQLSPMFYLPITAAQEHGIFKKNGLEVEWTPSQSGADMTRAFAASAIKIAISSPASDTIAIARGVPLSVVASMQSYDDFAIWVSTKGKISKPQDLAGAKIGVSRFGGLEHSYAQLAVKKLSLQNKAQFVSTGGINESLAALVTGSIDAVVLPLQNVLTLQLDGKVRDIADIKSFLPKEWSSYSIVASKDFIANDTDKTKRMVQSLLAANRFVMSAEGKQWALAKMQEMNHYSADGAKTIYERISFSQDGKIDPKAIQNLLDFMSEYEILKKGEVPPIGKVIDDRFVH